MTQIITFIMTVSERVDYLHLSQALSSLERQNSVEFRFLAVVSDEKTRRAIAHRLCTFSWYQDTILTFHSKGRVAKFNFAVSLVQTEYFFVIDADDYLSANAAFVLNLLVRRYSTLPVFSSYHYFCDEKLVVKRKIELRPTDCTLEMVATKFCQRHLWGVKTEFWRNSDKLSSHKYAVEDYIAFLHFARIRCGIGIIPTPLYYYRKHSRGISSLGESGIHSMFAELIPVVNLLYRQNRAEMELADTVYVSKITIVRDKIEKFLREKYLL